MLAGDAKLDIDDNALYRQAELAKLKQINAAVYWTTVGNQSTKAQIGFTDWYQDYPHPLDWFDVLAAEQPDVA